MTSMIDKEPSGAWPARYAKAYATYDEIRTIQADAVRAAINLYGQGEVFYRLPPNTHSVKVLEATPKNDADKENFRRFGFSEDDMQEGLKYVMEQTIYDPEKRVYDGQKATGLIDATWITTTGKILSYDASKQEYVPTTPSSYTSDALGRITRLKEIPGEIKNSYGSFERLKEIISPADTNGLDEYASVAEGALPWPWVPFKGEGLLPEHVRQAKPRLPKK